MLKTILIFSVVLLGTGLIVSAVPFGSTTCADVIEMATKHCNQTAVETYKNSKIEKEIKDAAVKGDMDVMNRFIQKLECCVGFDVINCIEKDIKEKCTASEAETFDKYMETSKDTLFKTACGFNKPSPVECA